MDERSPHRILILLLVWVLGKRLGELKGSRYSPSGCEMRGCGRVIGGCRLRTRRKPRGRGGILGGFGDVGEV
jgi:hypothetical protein